MKKIILVLLASFLLGASINAQTATPTPTSNQTATADTKPKRQIFRANKEQISTAQKMLKEKGLYTGTETGKLDDATRVSIKSFQSANGLKDTGTLNRATLEKMGIILTDAQKLIPVSDSSFADSSGAKTDKTDKPKRGPVFRANKDQIMQAQKLLKAKAMYSGEETGKLDDPTREGLKKFQAASALKVTGTLNRVTLEKLGIILTDKQKEMP